jgi:hypothetical protein
MSKHVNINQDFFNKWSPEMAWVLGVIYTDGFFGAPNSKRVRRLYISQKEPELLEKIKNLMCSNHKIIIRNQTDKINKMHFLSFTNEKIYNSLIRLGMMPNKSFILKFPQDIPQECVKHFLRGCWDGDGSFYYEYNDPRKVRGDFVSGSHDFIRVYVDKIMDLTGIDEIKIYNKHKNKNCYYIKMAPSQTVKLFPHFYDGVSEDMYLVNKYLKLKKSHEMFERIGP